MKRRILIFMLAIASLTAAEAQTTKVRGRAVDILRNEGAAFASIYFKDTTIGTTTDQDGYFSIETDNDQASAIVCSLMGYETQEHAINRGSFNEVLFPLLPSGEELPQSHIKADNKRAKWLLSNIDAHRQSNNPENLESYKVKIYNKIEFDLADPHKHIKSKKALEEFGFVFDYIDTSTVSGTPYLPAMISEAVIDKSQSGGKYCEVIEANKISGVNPEANLLSQFTGTLNFKTDFYKSFIDIFGVELPSPLQKDGLLYYNYYIIDSLSVNGRSSYLVRYHPRKLISSPAFDGEMTIDCDDYALKSIHAKLKHGSNINWIKDIALDCEYDKKDSVWFYKQESLYMDLSTALNDSTGILNILGSRKLDYGEPLISGKSESILTAGTKVSADAGLKNEQYWQQARPRKLSSKEEGIYKMVDQVKGQPLYTKLYKLAYTLTTGYYDAGPVGFGPLLKMISWNNLEGFRPMLSMHTSKEFSKKMRLSGFAAYGTRDRQFKGGLEYERIFDTESFKKLTLEAYYDTRQLGCGTSIFTSGNLLSSFWQSHQRLLPISNFSAIYEHEFSPNINVAAGIAAKRYYSNAFVPMADWQGNSIRSAAANEISLRSRFSWDESVSRGYFDKRYLGSEYPVITLNLSGSVPGIRKEDFGYFRPEISLNWRPHIPPIGTSSINFNAGTIIGKVPYPLLQLHEGNATNFIDDTAFSCMDYFEFASDSWATLFWRHNFNGLILGKIPLVRRLNLREEFIAKAAYGSLSDRNNGTMAQFGAAMPFPTGTASMGGVPYIELGCGVSNIFRIMRVDCIWRVTHRENARRLFTVNFGAEIQF